jgi:hypothetical protein
VSTQQQPRMGGAVCGLVVTADSLVVRALSVRWLSALIPARYARCPSVTALLDLSRRQLSPFGGTGGSKGGQLLGGAPERERNCVEDSIWPLEPSVETGIDLADVALLALTLHQRRF